MTSRIVEEAYAVPIIKFPKQAREYRPYAVLDSQFRVLAGCYGSRRIAKRELARIRESHPDAKLWVSLMALAARLEAIDRAIGKSRRAISRVAARKGDTSKSKA